MDYDETGVIKKVPSLSQNVSVGEVKRAVSREKKGKEPGMNEIQYEGLNNDNTVKLYRFY